jgi:hypothetical protein
MWKRLAKKLEVQEPRGKPFRGTSLDDLREFEEQHEFAFPQSYRAFAVEVGAGLFCGYYRIFAPDFGLEDELKTRGLDLFKQIYDDPSFVDRMMPFGSTIGGDVIAWDPEDVTSSRPREYGVYVLPRDSSKIVRLCSDFRTYVNTICFGHGLMIALYGAPDPEWEIEFTMERFRPNRRPHRYQLPPDKRKPSKHTKYGARRGRTRR